MYGSTTMVRPGCGVQVATAASTSGRASTAASTGGAPSETEASDFALDGASLQAVAAARVVYRAAATARRVARMQPLYACASSHGHAELPDGMAFAPAVSVSLRVMTYNIRNGRGLDNHVDLARIASVIAPFDPHIVALQEVDVGRARSGSVDQAHTLAGALGMTATSFCACVESGLERYGIATLSRLPIVESRELALPHRGTTRRSEPRRALLTRHDWDGVLVDMVNTHLSILPGERQAQVDAIRAQLAGARVIVAGDFNCTPWSAPYRTLACNLTSATRSRTWPSRLPFLSLDHILFRGLDVVRAGAWTAGAARQASDHLPVFAELAS